MSDIFSYRNGELHAEEVPVSRIAAAVRTPFYLYSTAGFTALYRRFAEALAPEAPLDMRVDMAKFLYRSIQPQAATAAAPDADALLAGEKQDVRESIIDADIDRLSELLAGG